QGGERREIAVRQVSNSPSGEPPSRPRLTTTEEVKGLNERTEARNRLIADAIRRLAAWSGQGAAPLPPDLPQDAEEWLAPYRALLGRHGPPPVPGDPLLSIFARIQDPEGQADAPQVYWRAEALTLDPIPEPRAAEEARLGAEGLERWWQGFESEVQEVLKLPTEARFTAFTHLLHRWAWAVPCSYGEAGVSFYDEFRALSALVFASGCAATPADEFLLVGGDIPGIQQTLYTITSKGAAKGLRGRSFFIQLLGDAVVRRLLAELDLPESNVIYAAGGNFMLLAPTRVERGDRDEETEDVLRRVLRQVNAGLVKALQGDTALVLTSVPVESADLSTPDRFRGKREDLGEQLAQAKNRPLRELADDWAVLFAPQGTGGKQSCAVCRIEVDEGNSKLLEPTGETPEAATEPPRICYLCASLGELARAIRHEKLWMAVEEARDMLNTSVQPTDGWAELLARMTGFRYSFHDEPPGIRGTVLAVNRPNSLPKGAHGFRLLANVTPTTTKEDVRYLREQVGLDRKDLPHMGEIRSFTLLAHAAARSGAIERVGVLRMDVDNLGQIFSEGLPDLTLPKLSALSRMMDLFFSGCLNTLVRKQAENDLYIIYAGGDDLFIVGAWHRLPELAESIRDRFEAFVGKHPALSLSGGLTLENPKFPLYRAAERAGEAEDRAKGYTHPDGRRKDAFCFLGTVVGWEDWAKVVRDQKDELLWLIGEDEENWRREEKERERRLPRALLQIVQSIHRLYHDDLLAAQREARRTKAKPPNPRLFYGRWMWMRVYSLTRLAERRGRRDISERVTKLQNEFIKPATVRYSGLAARWAEYLTRREEN
ncbi:MAG TPA: type III-A CRISPR-associated protein Cas10/Csm1, partial [Anaerolineae bacterium]|nr:type III-A CRISPR-associated protein Cas10/Csm1 [Anaerolineae bacterium]